MKTILKLCRRCRRCFLLFKGKIIKKKYITKKHKNKNMLEKSSEYEKRTSTATKVLETLI